LFVKNQQLLFPLQQKLLIFSALVPDPEAKLTVFLHNLANLNAQKKNKKTKLNSISISSLKIYFKFI
jgi:hypothetical protein